MASTHLSLLSNHLCVGQQNTQSPTTSLAELWQSYRGQVEEQIAIEYHVLPTTATAIAPAAPTTATPGRSLLSVREQFQQATTTSSSPSSRPGQLMMLSASPDRVKKTNTTKTSNNNNNNNHHNHNHNHRHHTTSNNNHNESPPPPLPTTTSLQTAATISHLTQEVQRLEQHLKRQQGKASAFAQRESALESELETALERADTAITSLEEQLATARANVATAAANAAATAVACAADGTVDTQVAALQERLVLATEEHASALAKATRERAQLQQANTTHRTTTKGLQQEIAELDTKLKTAAQAAQAALIVNDASGHSSEANVASMKETTLAAVEAAALAKNKLETLLAAKNEQDHTIASLTRSLKEHVDKEQQHQQQQQQQQQKQQQEQQETEHHHAHDKLAQANQALTLRVQQDQVQLTAVQESLVAAQQVSEELRREVDVKTHDLTTALEELNATRDTFERKLHQIQKKAEEKDHDSSANSVNSGVQLLALEAQVCEVLMIHVGGTRCGTSNTDHTMNIHARITLGVA